MVSAQHLESGLDGVTAIAEACNRHVGFDSLREARVEFTRRLQRLVDALKDQVDSTMPQIKTEVTTAEAVLSASMLDADQYIELYKSPECAGPKVLYRTGMETDLEDLSRQVLSVRGRAVLVSLANDCNSNTTRPVFVELEDLQPPSCVTLDPQDTLFVKCIHVQKLENDVDQQQAKMLSAIRQGDDAGVEAKHINCSEGGCNRNWDASCS